MHGEFQNAEELAIRHVQVLPRRPVPHGDGSLGSIQGCWEARGYAVEDELDGLRLHADGQHPLPAMGKAVPAFRQSIAGRETARIRHTPSRNCAAAETGGSKRVLRRGGTNLND